MRDSVKFGLGRCYYKMDMKGKILQNEKIKTHSTSFHCQQWLSACSCSHLAVNEVSQTHNLNESPLPHQENLHVAQA